MRHARRETVSAACVWLLLIVDDSCAGAEVRDGHGECHGDGCTAASSRPGLLLLPLGVAVAVLGRGPCLASGRWLRLMSPGGWSPILPSSRTGNGGCRSPVTPRATCRGWLRCTGSATRSASPNCSSGPRTISSSPNRKRRWPPDPTSPISSACPSTSPSTPPPGGPGRPPPRCPACPSRSPPRRSRPAGIWATATRSPATDRASPGAPACEPDQACTYTYQWSSTATQRRRRLPGHRHHDLAAGLDLRTGVRQRLASPVGARHHVPAHRAAGSGGHHPDLRSIRRRSAPGCARRRPSPGR